MTLGKNRTSEELVTGETRVAMTVEKPGAKEVKQECRAQPERWSMVESKEGGTMVEAWLSTPGRQ